MKFTIQSDTLKAAIKRLSNIHLPNPVLPVISNMLVTASKKGDEGTVQLTVTNMFITASIFVPATIREEGTGLIDFSALKKIVALEDGDIDISFSKKKVVVTCGTDEFNLGKAEAVEDYPTIPRVAEQHLFKINGTFTPTIGIAAVTVSKDDMKPAMTRISVAFVAGKAKVCSTNGYQLYEREISAEASHGTEPLLIAPQVAALLEGYNEIKIGCNKNHIAFASDSIQIYCKQTEGSFPAYQALLKPHLPSVTLVLGELQEAIKKCLVVAHESPTNRIVMAVNNMEGYIELKAESPDAGRFASCRFNAETIACPVTEMFFNAKQFEVSLGQLEQHTESGKGEVELTFENDSKPLLIRVKGSTDHTVLVMPIKG